MLAGQGAVPHSGAQLREVADRAGGECQGHHQACQGQHDNPLNANSISESFKNIESISPQSIAGYTKHIHIIFGKIQDFIR